MENKDTIANLLSILRDATLICHCKFQTPEELWSIRG